MAKKAKDNKARTEIRTHIDEDGKEWQIKVWYDKHGEPWIFQDVTDQSQSKITRRPFRPEDRPKRERKDRKVRWVDTLVPDFVEEWTDNDGKRHRVFVMYNHDPDAPTLEEVFARLLVNNYEAMSRMFRIIIPALVHAVSLRL
ncbi:MAG: hypothetical protein K6T81_03075 [Alicyclobacillus macrosporangiidus]|uniref:hypothetical protein n=1 Tax=Alicyclobacillus macrosporangiidus TaxID=392015 RepID=UPI0026F17C61|nr:hypothetical protein [Alicyclobacillus macrosporangiidus]MCL6597704.1 hypothetical protein [Alicyclobacillus macrosporangiidus]